MPKSYEYSKADQTQNLRDTRGQEIKADLCTRYSRMHPNQTGSSYCGFKRTDSRPFRIPFAITASISDLQKECGNLETTYADTNDAGAIF